MPLYTFIMQFREGTYVAQVRAENPCMAKRKWAESIDIEHVWGMGQATKSALVEALAGDIPSPIDTVQNVWCLYVRPRGYPCLVNFVQTAE